MFHSKAVLFIDDDIPEVFKGDFRRKEGVGADDDIDFPLFDGFKQKPAFLVLDRTGQKSQPDTQILQQCSS